MKREVVIKVDWDGHNYAACPENEEIACLATGKTLDEVKANMIDALQQHIAWMKEDGDAIPIEFQDGWQPVWRLNKYL